MIGRGTVEAEEKRSYGALFLLLIALLIGCMLWALWQDTFSRHLWKKYKTDFYRFAIGKYEAELVKDRQKLEADETYVALTKELGEIEAGGAATNETAARVRELQKKLTAAEISVFEDDLNFRFVKGEIEEAWYYYEKARHEGKDGHKEKARLDSLLEKKIETEKTYDHTVGERDAIVAELAQADERKLEITEKLRPYHKTRELLALKLDAVSLSVFGYRVPKVPVIDQVVLPGFERNNFEQWVDRVDRCQNCHVPIDTAGFEEEENPIKTHPDRAYYLGNHEKMGCTPCHGGQGPSINSVEQAHGEVAHWEDPLLPKADKIQAKCLTCHPSALGMKGADVAARGESLFREMGCHGCHLLEGFEHLDSAGPSLKRIAAKAKPEWLVEWVNEPHTFRPRTRMPDFLFDREQAIDVAAYLLASSLEDGLAWLETHEEPTGVNPGKAAQVASGKELTQSLGCLGCHGFEEDQFASQVAESKDTGPNLARIAEKTDARWTFHWLQNPRAYSEVARMPSLRVSDEEASAITSYLMTLKKENPAAPDPALRKRLAEEETIARGEQLVRRYGCGGCHVVNGMQGESRVSVELSTFGGKHPDELAFGNRDDLEKTWDAWTFNKILTPRTYATERLVSAMPMFRFSESDARALTVFLASKVESKLGEHYTAHNAPGAIAALAGRESITRYNCQGCHSLDGLEGAIRKYYKDEDIVNAPPVLRGEGLKVQSDWFVEFLKAPVRMRPWLKVRMPTFGLSDEEASKIVGYFEAVEGYNLGGVVVQGPGEADAPASGAEPQQVPEGYFECGACHMEGPGRVPEDKYWLSRVGLTDEAKASWLAQHLDIKLPGTGGDHSRADELREFLGTGVGGP